MDSPEHDKVVELPTKTAEAKRTITNSMEMEFFLNHKNHPPPMSAEKAVIVPVIVPQVLKPSTPSFLEKPAVIERSPMIDIPSTPKRDELLPPRTPLSESGSHISVTPITSGIPVMVTTPATNYQLISGHLDENDWESSSHQDDLQSMSVHNMQQMQIIPPQIMQNPPFTITAPYNANTELTNISGPRDRPMTYRDFKNAKALRRDNVSSFDDQLADRDGEKNRFGNNNNNNNNYRPGPAGRNDRLV